jgi:hypothetical protein
MSNPGTQVQPSASQSEAPSGTAFLATGSPEIVVFAGPAASGPVNVPTVIGAGDPTGILETTFQGGAAVKEAARFAELVSAQFVFMRLASATVIPYTTTPVLVQTGSSNWTGTVAGSPTDGADLVVQFLNSGTTGTTGIDYEVSYNGGLGFGASTPLTTATTIMLLGVTITLGSGKIVTTGDSIAFSAFPGASQVLPVSYVRATGGSPSTGTVAASGTPIDRYQFQLEVLAGFTTGTPGGIVRYTLDAGYTWTDPIALQANTTLVLVDGPNSTVSTGLTITFTGAFAANDAASFNTTAMQYDGSGLPAGMTALKNWTGAWTWVRLVGETHLALWEQMDGILVGWAAAKRWSWAIMDSRDRRLDYETLAAWSSSVGAELAQFTSTHVGIAVGMGRLHCAVTGRFDRRSSAICAYVCRFQALPIWIDPAQFDLGAVPDVSIVDQTLTQVEHDARLDPSLQGYGALALRTWDNYAGVYPNRGSLPGATGDLQLVPLRRVMNRAEAMYQGILLLPICRSFRVVTAAQASSSNGKLVAGNIWAPDINAIQREGQRLMTAALAGMVSSVTLTFNPTPIPLGGGSYQLTSELDIVALIYVAGVVGTTRFVSALTGST